MGRAKAENLKTDRKDSRTVLLDAAAALLSERSNLDITFSDISKLSGLNAALIKYYFGNKDGLFFALLERAAERSMDELDNLVSKRLRADKKFKIHIREMIESYFRSPYIHYLTKHLMTASTPEMASNVRELFIKPVTEAYRAIIDQGVKEGLFRHVDSNFVYYSLIGACTQIFYASYSLPTVVGVSGIDEDLKEKYLKHVTEIFLKGILA